MNWLTLLNPLNWIKVLSLLKSLWEMGVSAYRLYQESRRKREQEKVIDAINSGESKIDEANKIEDDKERLKEKAGGACEIEKSLNPDADC